MIVENNLHDFPELKVMSLGHFCYLEKSKAYRPFICYDKWLIKAANPYIYEA